MHTPDKARVHGPEAYLTNRFGHAAVRWIAKALWGNAAFKKLVAQNQDTVKLLSEGLVALTSWLEFGGDNPLVRFANFIGETFANENLELFEQFKANPADPALASQVEAKIGEVGKRVADAEVVLAFDHFHRDDKCVPVAKYRADTTDPDRTGKDGKVIKGTCRANITRTNMSSAIAARKPPCGICYPHVPTSTAPSKESAPSRNFMEFVMRLKKEEPDVFRSFWTLYLYRLTSCNDGQVMAEKFQQAFTGKHGYEAFRFVVGLPDVNAAGVEEWHHALDALLGKATPKETLREQIQGFIDKEAAETEEMLRALDEWIRRGNKKRAAEIRRLKKDLKLERQAFELMVAEEQEKRSKSNMLMLVALVLLIAACVIAAIHNKNGSSKKEQKVEKVDVR